jgi:hypothetical protein
VSSTGDLVTEVTNHPCLYAEGLMWHVLCGRIADMYTTGRGYS